jgi:hypothetical protein
MKDKLLITLFAVFCLGLMWFGWHALINPDEETGGFALIFMTPLLLVTTLGLLFQIGRMWLGKQQ